MYIKLDRDYEVKATLGTIREIERAFNRSFYEIANAVAGMKVDEQIKLLYTGVKRAHPDMTEQEFYALCEDNLGLGDLMEYLEKFFYALQYPGLSEEEVQERIEKKLERNRAMKAGAGSIGMNS